MEGDRGLSEEVYGKEREQRWGIEERRKNDRDGDGD